ncbi:hypothetical protein SAMN04488134_10774 [Amphibacillus marinus]|uniref:Uncharacterized protein n=1 Tax=Amphibacillus marinus TaxID=872970 RepID=A0A1H8PH04_9BACI|nr:hypothetical protein [Amphibacillus marinus]SEO41279.1 hypothetical protein SAMN04488134_10774 [Amphibacillus marinus]
MVETFLDFALGRFGRSISQFYIEHQLFFNSTVVIVSLSMLFKPSFLTKKNNNQ